MNLKKVAKMVKGPTAKSIGLQWSTKPPAGKTKPGKFVQTVVGGTPVAFRWNAKTHRYMRIIDGAIQHTADGSVIDTPNVVVEFCKVTTYTKDRDVNGNPAKFTKTIGTGTCRGVPRRQAHRRHVEPQVGQRRDDLQGERQGHPADAGRCVVRAGCDGCAAEVDTTYIRATADQVWDALTDPELTGRFWGHAQISDWTVGSRVEHVRVDGSGIADAVGAVVEVDQPRRLAFTFDDPANADDPTIEPSLVTFDIESSHDIVKLVVTHTRLHGTEELRVVGEGWPTVMANLKTLLETGDVLPQAPWEFHADERAARMAKNS